MIWGRVSWAEVGKPGIMGVSGAKMGENGAVRGEKGWGEVEVAVARCPKDKSNEDG